VVDIILTRISDAAPKNSRARELSSHALFVAVSSLKQKHQTIARRISSVVSWVSIVSLSIEIADADIDANIDDLVCRQIGRRS
jgi:hypothetical protein